MNISKISYGYNNSIKNNLAFNGLHLFKRKKSEKNNKDIKSMEQEADNLRKELHPLSNYYSVVIPSHEIERKNPDGSISVDYVKINNIIKDKIED